MMVTTVKMSSGYDIPVLGFGTYQAANGEEAYQSTLAAIKAGYRHIDTAAIYKKEEALQAPLKIQGFLGKSCLLQLNSGMTPIVMKGRKKP